MSITSFLTAVREGRAVTVPPPGAAGDRGDAGGVTGALEAMDAAARAEVAYGAPPLMMDVARWAAGRLYQACQFLVYRDVEAEAVRAGCAVACPAAAASPAVCYSADLMLRYLPDVYALARGVAREDPLVEGLVSLARAWPLSSVGMAEVGKVDVAAFIGHAGLRRLYVDRIIERNDRSRLDDAAVVAAVREAIGAFPEIAPRIWAVVSPESEKHVEAKHV
jgi:hypothetical protein